MNRAKKLSKKFQEECRPQFSMDKFIAILMRTGITRPEAVQVIQEIRESAWKDPVHGLDPNKVARKIKHA